MTSPEPRPRICLATAGGPHPWILARSLAETFEITIVREAPESTRAFLRRRARMSGWLSTAGQFMTMVVIRFGKRLFRKRVERHLAEAGASADFPQELRLVDVPSVNSDAFLDAVRTIQPDAVLLVGCRMLKPRYLERLEAPVLNYHAGITPAYRGMNGGYWARLNGDVQNYGSTVHLVDPGVDTGRVVRHQRLAPRADDTIMTDAYRIAAASSTACREALEIVLEGGPLPAVPAPERSRQWFHPPIWTYLWHGVTRRVW
ncbi:formyl transferase [Tianweitania sediminis]|uniref:phosphoribosylglycinamide formyltransferase 1 n=1 Tax=Tianweitania sediminis TaxID=1502156 RepID=A0A8J7R589_9HYPH|nr:formyl transferase [Tianweitania sediminis]MBP0441493.1 formyl transferase [Tianweitania sediminis]